jgi:hypothetical protein
MRFPVRQGPHNDADSNFVRIDDYNQVLNVFIHNKRATLSRFAPSSSEHRWQDDAKCVNYPFAIWDSPATIEQARPICQTCPVKKHCLKQGLSENITQHGIDFPTFAGLSGPELYRLQQTVKMLNKGDSK